MQNPITEDFQLDLDDLVRIVDGKTVCKICGVLNKNLYSTNKGYVCKTCI